MSVRLRMVGYSHGFGMVSLGNHGHGIMSRKATPSMIFLKKQLSDFICFCFGWFHSRNESN